MCHECCHPLRHLPDPSPALYLEDVHAHCVLTTDMLVPVFCDKNQCLESQVLCKCQRLLLISSRFPLRSQIAVSPQILPECFKTHTSWDSACGRQVPGLEALQRADIVTFCLMSLTVWGCDRSCDGSQGQQSQTRVYGGQHRAADAASRSPDTSFPCLEGQPQKASVLASLLWVT